MRIRNNTIILVNSIITKPVFDTQLKETLKTSPKLFDFEFSTEFLKKGISVWSAVVYSYT